MRALLLVIAAVLFGGSCAVGIGQSCMGDDGCAERLVCSKPPLPDGGTAELGVCDYPLGSEGDPCVQAAQCASDLTCSNHFDVGGRYGTCIRRHAAGESCWVNRDCQSNQCVGATGNLPNGTCE